MCEHVGKGRVASDEPGLRLIEPLLMVRDCPAEKGTVGGEGSRVDAVEAEGHAWFYSIKSYDIHFRRRITPIDAGLR